MLQFRPDRSNVVIASLLLGLLAQYLAESLTTTDRALLSSQTDPELDAAYTEGYEYSAEEVESHNRLQRNKRLQLAVGTASTHLAKRSDWGIWACNGSPL